MAKQVPLSPEKYITTKARELPFYQCFITSRWQVLGIANILISRKQPSGHFIVGMYLIDIYCLGLKNTTFRFNLSEVEYMDFVHKFKEAEGEARHCDFAEAHNIIYGAIDYAEELGFSPQKDFKVTEYILNPKLIDDGIDQIQFGKNGKPYYFAGPYDNTNQILGVLKRNVGEGNFEFTIPTE